MCPKVRFVFSEVEMKVTGFKMKELLNLRKKIHGYSCIFFFEEQQIQSCQTFVYPFIPV